MDERIMYFYYNLKANAPFCLPNESNKKGEPVLICPYKAVPIWWYTKGTKQIFTEHVTPLSANIYFLSFSLTHSWSILYDPDCFAAIHSFIHEILLCQ